MRLDQEMIDFFNKQVQHFQRGIFCPAIMWELLASRMSEETALSYLNAIAPENQIILQNSYHERPMSLNSASREDQKTVRLLIEKWCQQSISHQDA